MRHIYIMEKGRFLVSGTSHNCLKKRCFFLFFIKKIPATESICAFLLYFFFALSISSVKFSKKVFFIRRPENFSRLFDCSKAGLSICHVKYFPPACASGISCSKPQSPGLKTSQAYDCAGMPASSCLCRRFKNIKEKRGLFNRSLFPARQVPVVYFPVLKAELFCHGSVNC